MLLLCMMGGTWPCNVSLMLPIFALITVFLESLGILDIFAILSSILLVVGSRQYMVPALLKFQIAAGDRPCFIFSNRDGLFVIQLPSMKKAHSFQLGALSSSKRCCCK